MAEDVLVVGCTVGLDYVRLGRRANFFARTAERERSMRRATWRSDMVPIIASSFRVHRRNGPSRSKRRRSRSDILRLNWTGFGRRWMWRNRSRSPADSVEGLPSLAADCLARASGVRADSMTCRKRRYEPGLRRG